jgi:hypothetical protein
VIWELQASGAESLRAIADGLNAAGIPTARGQGKWSAVQVSRLLKNIPDKPTKREIRESKALEAALVEGAIDRGQLSEQQIADWRERGIAPAMRMRLATACGKTFDGGPDLETSCSVEAD